MDLKIYQDNAIQGLLDKSKQQLAYSGNRTLVFKAPTGSGKTIMMAELLRRMVSDREIRQSLSFIWTAPQKLHQQSYDKLNKYYEKSHALKCSYFDELIDKKIGENEILFFNWESINKKDNIIIRENEEDLNLSKVLEKTKDEHRVVILIIDEAHHHAKTEIAEGLIKMISPKLTIEVSATPVISKEDDKLTIDREDVVKEGMIKKSLILNDGFKNLIHNGKIRTELTRGSEELVLEIALKKRRELIKLFKKEKSKVNPLVLIQLPNNIGSIEDLMKDRIQKILKRKYGVTAEKGNNKLAIWISQEHINKENVERLDSKVEVLIFKQAITIGWDCPRAHILALFREWHSPTFSIQTVGRIMRMPEPERGHYKNEALNHGYVFTNLSDIDVKDDLGKDYVTIYTSKREKGYKAINLTSYHSKRHREKTRLTPLFINMFLKYAKKYNLRRKIDDKAAKISMKLIADWKTENVDSLAHSTIKADESVKAAVNDKQKQFDFFIRKHLSPFYPEDRSISRVKDSIYRFFEKELKMKYADKWDRIVQIVLNDKNEQHFVAVLELAKEEYKRETEKAEKELIPDLWNVPQSLIYGANYVKSDKRKSIMKPFYHLKDNWKSEEAFIKILEGSSGIEWWFKNGDRDATFFAVPYNDGDSLPFYVDFIVKYKKGVIGLFDVKGELTAKIAGPKITGLFNYIKHEKTRGKKLYGGLVKNTDDRKYNGRWIICRSPEEFIEGDFSKWASF